MTASNPSLAPAPDPREDPRAFLEHLYRVAVDRALPLGVGAWIPLGPGLPQPRRGLDGSC
ncbi:hypothetical protein [Variovorax paradoxus]|uniref:hypothetical protein n=1 Tax=Variovorax paradoxus TaxID=34073 RepID=UPI001F1F9AF2|nr:hypothetical protein [Variovorax paradoxus]UKI12024.1 hypothetical protein L3V85_35905 [Variovorax paradoxus]